MRTRDSQRSDAALRSCPVCCARAPPQGGGCADGGGALSACARCARCVHGGGGCPPACLDACGGCEGRQRWSSVRVSRSARVSGGRRPGGGGHAGDVRDHHGALCAEVGVPLRLPSRGGLVVSRVSGRVCPGVRRSRSVGCFCLPSQAVRCRCRRRRRSRNPDPCFSSVCDAGDHCCRGPQHSIIVEFVLRTADLGSAL